MENREQFTQTIQVADNVPNKITSPQKKVVFRVIYLGLLTLLTVTATALLHTNQKEFILDRFSEISSFKLSLFDTILYFAYFVAGITMGIFSDRLAKRKLFIMIGSIGASLLLYLLTLTLNYSLLLFLRFIQGCFSIMVWQMLMTIILDISSSANRGKNMGIYGVFLGLGMGLGPMLGGFVATRGVFIPYYVASGLMVFVFILSFFLREPETLIERSTIKESVLILKSDPKIIIPCLFNFIDRLHMGFIIFALPLIIGLDINEGGLGLAENYRGIAFGIFALPFILLQYPFGRISDKIGRYLPLIIGSCCYGIVLSMLGYFGGASFTILLVLLVLLGIFSGVTSPPSMALIGDKLGDSKKNGAGMGLFTLFGNIGIVIGPLIAGLLINYGFGITFLVAGILELFGLGVNIILIRFIFKEKIGYLSV
ncbi:MAG: MFS transporter [Candidatus Heimdallarchaeota archaeon]|nr:MFS transporter [Candidatus Heimdallarchaeota archaeon]